MRLFALFFGFVVLGCGGKIVETSPTPAPASTSTTNEEREAPVVVAPAAQASLDACTVLCERDARCDTTVPALPSREGEAEDCPTRCEEALAGRCGRDEWLLCYAARIDANACAPLPDECRPAFCAWARCSRQPVSNCD